MTKTDWQESLIAPETQLGEAIAKIDAAALQVAIAVNADRTLAGILTDGDIRRAILAGKSLQTPVKQVMNRRPTSVPLSQSRTAMLALMRHKAIHHLPLVDDRGRVVGLMTLDDLIGAVERSNWAVIMAGGLGTRLQPLTYDLPKPLLKVGGKPILDIIIESLAAEGFQHIFLAVNYKAEMIEQYCGSGDRWGVTLHYLHENKRLGTAGALSLLPERPTEPIIVMNGDILTRTSFSSLLQFHERQNAAATMAVREYDFQVPYGVVRMEETRITAIEEKPIQHFFVNAGIYALSPEIFDRLPEGTYFDMPALFEGLIASDRPVCAYPLREYWLDIGRLEEFDRAQREWGQQG